MRDQIVTYFAEEKSGAIVLFSMGLLALGAGLALALRAGSYRAAAIPLILLALAELGIGITVWARTDGQASALLQGAEQAPGDTARAEIARIERVRSSFAIFKIVEIVLIATGVALAYGLRRSDFAFALGVGFIAQAAALLVFDLVADRRAEVYLDALRGVVG